MKNEVQYYSEHLQALAHSQSYKAEKFLEHGCLEYDKAAKAWKVKPIEGYNTTTHEIHKENGEFICSCQGCQKKVKEGERPNCSHIGALYLFFERRNKTMGWGPYRQGVLG